jgi:DNA segregation ATPase FtsK/SpoIIIE, S-DNA-T family
VAYVRDLFRSQNFFVAGDTSRRRTAGIDALICSILYKSKPEQLRLLLIDSERREFDVYSEIPHLISPIIDSRKANTALKWIKGEISLRQEKISLFGVRNIDEYNVEVKIRNSAGYLDGSHCQFPRLVIIINELSEFLKAGTDISGMLSDMMGRSVPLGIHFIVAAQRIDRELGAFVNELRNVAKLISHISAPFDSRYILNEKDTNDFISSDEMLLLDAASSERIRLNEANLDLFEISRVVEHLHMQPRTEYELSGGMTENEIVDLPGRHDPLFNEALRCVVQANRASTSLLQRHLTIGYGRAAAILDVMVLEGYIGEMDGKTRTRAILPRAYEDLKTFKNE